MIPSFRKLPLTFKLLLIGIIPLLFLFYFAFLINKEETRKIQLIRNYIHHVELSKRVSELISQLTVERRESYKYALKTGDHETVVKQRAKTDSIILLLSKSEDLSYYKFQDYTFLDNLQQTRDQLDTVKNYGTYPIIQFYTNAIYRLNTLNATTPPANSFLKPIYQDLVAQKILSQLITFLSIIRMNIYDLLYTQQHVFETLFGTYGVYQVYITYEKEFALKASPASVKVFNANNNDTSDYHKTRAYLDKVFSTFKIDSTYNASEWWDVSTGGMDVLKDQQENLWKSVNVRMKDIYQKEVTIKNATLIFLLISILFVGIFVVFLVKHITNLLHEIKLAARKISRGETGLDLHDMPPGVIGSLAKSIVHIDKNNHMLVQAANEIGKGNFNVVIKPRSEKDLLSISIKKMKADLRAFTAEKDKIQQETAELVERRDEFFSIASHELKTPITSLKAYTQLLAMDFANDPQSGQMLAKMDFQIDKLTSLISTLLDSSKVQDGQLNYNNQTFEINELTTEVVNKIGKNGTSRPILFHSDVRAKICGDRGRIAEVINHLIVNAIKFAHDSEKILIDLKEQHQKIIFSVRDFGNGIAENERSKIFERFYRILGNNLHTYPGLGLGLYISREIIEHHDGKIWVESEDGNGSTFYFELPICQNS
jgi:signal transduction histidine kinase